jgi:hypothetical protein
MKNLQRELEIIRNAGLAGDDQAAIQCESRIGNGLRRVIRRTIKLGHSTTELTSRILEEARRAREEFGYQRDELVAEVASRLVSIIAGQGYEGRIDTIQSAGEATITAAA